MNNIKSLTLRNLRLYFRNKSMVFFSLLSVLIVLMLYIMFLADLQVQNVQQMVHMDIRIINGLVYSWLLPGVIAIGTFTLTLANMSRLVRDTQSKALDDFMVAPLKRSELVLSYVTSTLIIAFGISMIMFVISLGTIYLKGDVILSWLQIIKSMGVILLLVISNTLFGLFIASFVISEDTYGVINSMVGTLIGFVAGAYMPMGIMPKLIQNIFNFLPISQGASLLRQIYLEDVLQEVFKGAPAQMALDYRYFQGIDLKIMDRVVDQRWMLLTLCISILLFFILNLIRFRSLKKRS